MTDEISKRFELAYKDALDNLLFIKQQQWTIVRYALTAYATLFVVARAIEAGRADKVLLTAAVWLVALYSWFVLRSFRFAIEKFRARLAWLYANQFSPEEADGLRLGEDKGLFNRWGLVAGLVGVSLAGAAITTAAIWR